MVNTPYFYPTNPKRGKQTRKRATVQYGVINKQINISTGEALVAVFSF